MAGQEQKPQVFSVKYLESLPFTSKRQRIYEGGPDRGFGVMIGAKVKTYFFR